MAVIQTDNLGVDRRDPRRRNADDRHSFPDRYYDRHLHRNGDHRFAWHPALPKKRFYSVGNTQLRHLSFSEVSDYGLQVLQGRRPFCSASCRVPNVNVVSGLRRLACEQVER